MSDLDEQMEDFESSSYDTLARYARGTPTPEGASGLPCAICGSTAPHTLHAPVVATPAERAGEGAYDAQQLALIAQNLGCYEESDVIGGLLKTVEEARRRLAEAERAKRLIVEEMARLKPILRAADAALEDNKRLRAAR